MRQRDGPSSPRDIAHLLSPAPGRATLGAMADRPQHTIYKVVVNHEEQYLVLPDADPLPAGWFDAGHRGTHDTCLEFLKPENAGRRGRPRKG